MKMWHFPRCLCLAVLLLWGTSIPTAAARLDKIGSISRTNGLNVEGSLHMRKLLQSDADKKLWNAAFNGEAEAAKEALDEGADVEVKLGPFSDTPLAAGALRGHLDIVVLLIDAGANLDATDDDSASPLFLASNNGHLEVVLALLDAGADVSKKRDLGGERPLFVAAERGEREIVKALINAGADVNGTTDSGATPLIVAAQNAHSAVVQTLLDSGADPQKGDELGDTALHAASITLGPDSEQITEDLLAAGVDANVPSTNGGTPLFWAVEFGNIGTVRILMDAGADPDVVDEDGDTPRGRICACQEYEGQAGIVQCPKGGCDQETTRTEIAELLSK